MGTEEFRLPERDDAFQDITFNIQLLQFHRYGKHMIRRLLDRFPGKRKWIPAMCGRPSRTSKA